MNIYDVIKKPLITEKTTTEKDDKNVVSFIVDSRANKIEIRDAVKILFDVEIEAVKTVMVAGKFKRTGKYIGKRSNWKKAYVTLKKGSNVDFFEV